MLKIHIQYDGHISHGPQFVVYGQNMPTKLALWCYINEGGKYYFDITIAYVSAWLMHS